MSLACGAVAHAQGPVLHEYVPDVQDDEAAVLLWPDAAEPAAIVYDGEVLPAPGDGPLGEDERPMVATPGDGSEQEEPGQRSPSFRPDRVTNLEGTLGYYTVFSPSIAPYKRVTALDTIEIGDDGVPVLDVGSTQTVDVPVVGARSPPPDGRPRDQFWGSVVLDFAEGRRVPLPSVSPESRILSMRTSPRVSLHIARDRADNFYAVVDGSPPSTQVRLSFLTDAPRVYFNGPIPDVPSDLLGNEAPALPPSLRRSADTFATELQLRRGMPLPVVLAVLTEHFRSFVESDESPDDSGDIYLDLSRGMRGVCRHRAYAFVITAAALGIPSRFVMNEAHAWVEVLIPTTGWMRIDLGGAAEGLEARNAADRPSYRPALPDPLPRPPAYEQAYARANELAAERASTSTEPQRVPAAPGTSATPGQPGDGRRQVAGSDATDPGGVPDVEEWSQGVLQVVLDHRRYQVFRGRPLEVTGRLVSETTGEGVEGLRIEVLLSAERELLLGVTVSQTEGRFRAAFGVPPQVDVGEYRLLVRSPGNSTYGPATAW